MAFRSMARFSTVLSLLVFCASLLHARGLFVSPAGSNTTGNGTMENPWRTIAFALDSVYPGDTLFLRGGVYGEQVVTVRSGTPGAYITLTGYGNEDAFIDGAGGSWNNGAIVDHSYLRLEHFTVRTWLHTGIWLRGCQFVELKGLRITGVTGGISLTGTVHDFVVDSCVMYDYYGGAGGSGFDATPYGTDSIYNGVIRNSKAYLTAGAFDNCDGFALGHDGVANIHLDNCEVYGVGDGFDISGTDIVLERCSARNCTYGGGYKLWRENVTLVNCIAYNNSTNVELDYDGSEQRGVRARLINCTLYAPANANLVIENSAGGSRLDLFNSILAGGENAGLYFDGDTTRGYTGDYNLFHLNSAVRMIAISERDFSLTEIQNGEWTGRTGQDAHTQIVFDSSTLFEDTLTAGPDLRLRSGALAIDHGTPLSDAPLFDFGNCPRNVGTIDIGAYEFGGCGVSGTAEGLPAGGGSYRLERNFPNPFNPATTISYYVPTRSRVTVVVYDLLGREVATVVSGEREPGSYAVTFDASALSSGVYLYRMAAGGMALSEKMLLIK